MTVATLAGNRLRNRYNDIVPYDANRVKLTRPMRLPNETSFESDYVNASYLGATVAAAATTAATASSASCSRRESILTNPALSFANMDPGFIAAQVQNRIMLMHTLLGLSICSKYGRGPGAGWACLNRRVSD